MPPFSPIPDAIAALCRGEFVIVVDDEKRENEGDLILAAEHMTEQKMAFLIRQTGGVVCVSLPESLADTLELLPMAERNTSRMGTPFTVSIDAAEGVTTGISAADRTQTTHKLADPHVRPEDFRRPGHIFPLRAREGGVLVRAGHTEAAVDLCNLAELRPVAALSELMHEDGSMMRLPALQEFAHTHHVPIISIADLIAWRRNTESFVQLQAESDLETDTGMWKIKIYHDSLHHFDHVVLVKGTVSPTKPMLARVHSECMTGDVFASHHCDCGLQLTAAMEQMQKEGAGVLLYLRQEGRGVGLANKIRAYAVQQEEGLDTVDANTRLGLPTDLREYGIGAQILRDVGVCKMRLLTNNPKKMVGLEAYGLEVVEQVPLQVKTSSDRQKKYLQTKKDKMGHILKNI